MTGMWGPRFYRFLATLLVFVSWILRASAEPCDYGERLCPTSKECIDESKWCNGVKDCPDDEQDCVPGRAEDEFRPPYNAATCVVQRNFVKSFDGRKFTYKVCEHILLQDKNSREFFVKVHSRCSDGHHIDVCRTFVSIWSNKVLIELGPSLHEVKVNHVKVLTGSLHSISRRLRDVHLALSGQRLVFVSLKHKFQVVFDERRSIMIGVSKVLKESTRGLCGTFNSFSWDDFHTPEGTLEKSEKAFGDSWATMSPWRCPQPRCPPSAPTLFLPVKKLLQRSQLNQCLWANSDYWLSIIFGDFICDCIRISTDNEDRCICQAFEGLLATCSAAVRKNIDIDWRLSFRCECPAGMEWNDCGPFIEKTCENMHDKSNVFQDDCVPGCYCPKGQVRLGDSCVPPEFCHNCVCRGHGGSNYITFDGHYYNFQGNCSYVLAQHTSGNPQLDFRVIGTNVECPEEPGLTCTQSVTVNYLGHQVRIVRGQRITFDGYELRDVDNPWNNKGFNISWVPGRTSIVFVPAINLVVRYFDLNYGFSIELPSFTYFNKTKGLCGVCNFDESDDLLHRSGQVTSDVRSFAYSWLVEGAPEICSVKRLLSQRSFYTQHCDVNTNTCDLYVNPEPYQKSCVNDASYSPDLHASICRSEMHYAEHCCSKGRVSFRRWSHSYGCDNYYVCPNNTEFRCDSACPRTCDNYKKRELCPLMPTYSCFCKEGMVLRNGECVDIDRCESCDELGHRVGDTWQTGPCEVCNCTENLEVRCTRIVCPPPPSCRNNEQLRHEPARNGTCCEEFSCVPKNECAYIHKYQVVNGIQMELPPEKRHEKTYPVGDTWQAGPCETCNCTENLEVRCTRIVCPLPPTCSKDERLWHAPAPNGTCCDAYICELKRYWFCKKPQHVHCRPGEVQKIETDKDGCTSYICECERWKCPALTFSASLEPGFEVFVKVEDCCNELSVRCNPILCPDPPSCPPETELKYERGECCTTYKCTSA